MVLWFIYLKKSNKFSVNLGFREYFIIISFLLILLLFFQFYYFIVPCRKFRLPYLGKAQQLQEQSYPFLPLFNNNGDFLLGDSGGVVNSLEFCPASLKSLGCFYFRCVLSSQWKAVTVNSRILHCQH